MKKTTFAMLLALTLLSLTMQGARLIKLATANPYPYTNCDSSFVTISVVSPENRTYSTNIIQLTITAGAYPGIFYIGYSVDGKPFKEFAREKWAGHTFNETIWLYPLTKGSHSITVEASTPVAQNDVLNDYAEVHFTITKETTPPDTSAPQVIIFSPQNKTYYRTGIPLDFSVNESNCSVSYKFDGQDPVEISQNTTLIGFYYGSHNITVFATDVAGNTGVQTVVFTYDRAEEPIPSPEPFPSALSIAAVMIAAGFVVLSAGLLLYFRKRKH